MYFSKIILTGFLFCYVLFLHAQNELPVPRNIQATFDKATRSIDGKPGKNYWQNTAAYDIRINFNPSTRLISGEEDITYTNNSPDSLTKIVFKLYPNLYKKGSPRLMKIEPEDAGEGIQIAQLAVNGVQIPETDRVENGTNMMLKIPALAPKQSARFLVKFSFTLNKTSHIRTGEVEDGAYFIAYFFPRIAVYDDIDGWNANPYLGTQEFYNDFCDFKTAVTVPKDYVVWGTGDLKNCAEVFTPEYCQRIAKAEKSDDITTVIDSTDLKAGHITVNRPENTFRFEAQHVTDFVFALSNHYIWKSTSLVVDPSNGRRTRADAVFNPKHLDYFAVVDDARKTVEAMSFQFPKWPFPYAHITVFDGLDQMEYPMMVNDNPVEDRAESIELTDHEIFHTMFPFYMGINETKYGWMDEGWATIGEWLISPMIDPTIVDEYGMDRYEKAAGTEYDLPITTLTTQQSGTTMFINSYPKPALGYLYVKDMLGDELFYKGLHHYIRTWNGKHPMPYDFFYSMNTGTGVNLNWFWKRWFFDSGVPDLAIASFSEKDNVKQIIIASKGNKPVPVDLLITFTDNTVQKVHYSIEVWQQGNTTLEINIATDKTVKMIRLGSTYTADVNKADNEMVLKQ